MLWAQVRRELPAWLGKQAAAEVGRAETWLLFSDVSICQSNRSKVKGTSGVLILKEGEVRTTGISRPALGNPKLHSGSLLRGQEAWAFLPPCLPPPPTILPSAFLPLCSLPSLPSSFRSSWGASWGLALGWVPWELRGWPTT